MYPSDHEVIGASRFQQAKRGLVEKFLESCAPVSVFHELLIKAANRDDYFKNFKRPFACVPLNKCDVVVCCPPSPSIPIACRAIVGSFCISC